MAIFTVRKNKRYKAIIELDWLRQSIASADMIREKVEEVGFIDIEVQADGDRWVLEGTWPLDHVSAEMPDEVISCVEVGA